MTWQLWLSCQMLTRMYEPNTMIETPVARPSSPSVRLTAFDHAVMRKLAQSTKRIRPIVAPAKARSRLVSRRNEMCVEAGVRKFSLGNCSASTANVMPTMPWPMILARGESPRLRCLRILVKSSKNPTSPRPVMRKSTRIAEMLGVRGVSDTIEDTT
ncbi:hypothetical protein D3C74_363090 [compost metagenome]